MKNPIRKSISISINLGGITKKKAEKIARSLIRKKGIKGAKIAKALTKKIINASLKEKTRLKKLAEQEAKKVIDRIMKEARIEIKNLTKPAKRKVKRRR